MTPRTPLPCSDWARMTSTGLAVAQKIVQTSWHIFTALRTLIGKGIFHDNEEGVACSNLQGIFLGRLLQGLIVPFSPDKTVAGGLAESDPEF